MNVIQTGIQIPPTLAIDLMPIGYNYRGMVFPFGLPGSTRLITPGGHFTAKELWQMVGVIVSDREAVIGRIQVHNESTPFNKDVPLFKLPLPLRADVYRSGLIKKWKPILDQSDEKGRCRLLTSANRIPATTPIALPAGATISGEITMGAITTVSSGDIDLSTIALEESDYSYTVDDLYEGNLPSVNDDFEDFVPDGENIQLDDPDDPKSNITLTLTFTDQLVSWESKRNDGSTLMRNSVKRLDAKEIELIISAVVREDQPLGDLRFLKPYVQASQWITVAKQDLQGLQILGGRFIVNKTNYGSVNLKGCALVGVRIANLQSATSHLYSVDVHTQVDSGNKVSFNAAKRYLSQNISWKLLLQSQKGWINVNSQDITIYDESDSSRLTAIFPAVSPATQKYASLFASPKSIRCYLADNWNSVNVRVTFIKSQSNLESPQVLDTLMAQVITDKLPLTGQILINHLPTGKAVAWSLIAESKDSLLPVMNEEIYQSLSYRGLMLTSEVVRFSIFPEEVELHYEDSPGVFELNPTSITLDMV